MKTTLYELALTFGIWRVEELERDREQLIEWLAFWQANPQSATRDDARQAALLSFASLCLSGKGEPPLWHWPYMDDQQPRLDELTLDDVLEMRKRYQAHGT